MAVLALGVLACSNDDSGSPQQEVRTQNSIMSTNEGNTKVGEIVEGRVVPLFKPADFKREFLKYDLMAEVESVEINEHFLTIIGKDKRDFSLVSFQIRLEKVNSDLYFPSSGDAMQVLTTNKCTGNSCSSCDFTKDKDGKITGCKCGGTGTCDHTKTEDDKDNGLDTAEKVISIIADVISVVVLIL